MTYSLQSNLRGLKNRPVVVHTNATIGFRVVGFTVGFIVGLTVVGFFVVGLIVGLIVGFLVVGLPVVGFIVVGFLVVGIFVVCVLVVGISVEDGPQNAENAHFPVIALNIVVEGHK